MLKNKIYAVVPVYNVEKYLKRCVDSLINQIYSNLKIILVDDGSTDKSPEICDFYAEKFENITVIHKPNGGLSDARNAGLEACFSESLNPCEDWLTFVDSDDFLSKNFACRLIDICEKNCCDIVQCGYEKGDKDEFSSFDRSGKITVCDSKTTLLGYRMKSQCCAKLYRLSLFENEKFRTGVLNEDEFITYRIIYKCKKIAFTDEKLYYYFQRQGSIMNHIANKLKNSSHKNDWLYAYMERIEFFSDKEDNELVLKTYEKICTDIILRYTEQMSLEKSERDNAVINGEYLRTYRYFYKKMMNLKTIPFFRKMIYIAFNICPFSAFIISRIRPLRT